MKRWLVIFLFVSTFAYSQQTGVVDYPYLGIQFTIPEGWKGAEVDGGFLIGHDQIAGFIFLMPHEVRNIEQLYLEARRGIQEEGLYLQLSSDIEKSGAEGIGAEFSGIIQGSQAKAFIISLINPFGTGVTIVSAADSYNYSEDNKRLARELAGSLKFSTPKEAPFNQEWKKALSNTRLTYMESSYSGGASVGGYSSYSSYSSRIEIKLCGEQFTYSSSQSFSVDSGGGFGSGGGDGNGAGTWQIKSGAGGESILVLRFTNGDSREYSLTYENQKTYLNGKRYFRIAGEGCY